MEELGLNPLQEFGERELKRYRTRIATLSLNPLQEFGERELPRKFE